MTRPDIIQNRITFNAGALQIKCKPTRYHPRNTIPIPNFLNINNENTPQMWIRRMKFNHKTSRTNVLRNTIVQRYNLPIQIRQTNYLSSIDIFVLVKDINIINTPKNTPLYIYDGDHNQPIYTIISISPTISSEI